MFDCCNCQQEASQHHSSSINSHVSMHMHMASKYKHRHDLEVPDIMVDSHAALGTVICWHACSASIIWATAVSKLGLDFPCLTSVLWQQQINCARVLRVQLQQLCAIAKLVIWIFQTRSHRIANQHIVACLQMPGFPCGNSATYMGMCSNAAHLRSHCW